MLAPTPSAAGLRVTIENGRKRVVRSMQRDWRNWEVLIREHHEGYISWAEFEWNQQLIADNANGKRFMSRGAVRPLPLRPVRQEASRPLMARPIATSAWAPSISSQRRGASLSAGCASTGSAKEVLARLQPLGVEAALAAIEARSQQRGTGVSWLAAAPNGRDLPATNESPIAGCSASSAL